MGSTPVANGSSVPAWPTRCAPVSRRRRLTTEKDVSPAGLSKLRTPVANRAGGDSGLRRGGMDGLFGGRQHDFHGLFHRLFDLGARGPDVTPASKSGAQRGGVHRSTAAHAALGQVAGNLFEEDR